MGKSSSLSLRQIGWPMVVAALLGLVPAAPLASLAPAAATGQVKTDFCQSQRAVNIDIARWKIKKKVSVAYDLNEMAQTVGVDTSRTRDKIHNRAWGSYWVATLWQDGGLSAAQDVKIGTAKLRRPAAANMVINLESWYRRATGQGSASAWYKSDDASETRTTLVLFKGKRTADVYGRFRIRVLDPGKTVKNGNAEVTLAKPIKLTRGRKYQATSQPYFNYSNLPPLAEPNPDPINDDPYEYYGGNSGRSNTNSQPTCRPSTNIYYKNGTYPVNLTITAPSTSRAVSVYVKNKAQSLHSNLDSKNPIYKAARKLVGKPSASCDHTVAEALAGSKVNRNAGIDASLALPLGAGRTGDAVDEPGHISIYTGPGAMAIHGDVFSHKTFKQNSPLRHTYFVLRPYSNLFRYR